MASADDCKQRLEAGIVGDRAAGALGHAERGELRRLERGIAREELGVGLVGAGIAALDVVDAEIVEHGAMRRLSSTEKSTPVVCAPSRSVVSNR